VSIAPGGGPRVEIGDVVAGPGAVFAVVEDLMVLRERAGPGATLTGPFRVDALAQAALLAALEAELGNGSSGLDQAVLRATVDLIARRLAGGPGPRPCETQARDDPALPWDEANADVC
jgi:hypothetical protein